MMSNVWYGMLCTLMLVCLGCSTTQTDVISPEIPKQFTDTEPRCAQLEPPSALMSWTPRRLANLNRVIGRDVALVRYGCDGVESLNNCRIHARGRDWRTDLPAGCEGATHVVRIASSQGDGGRDVLTLELHPIETERVSFLRVRE